MRVSLASLSVLAVSLAALPAAQERADADEFAGPPIHAPVVQDWSWYPYELRPPFDSVGFADDEDLGVIHAGSARFRAGEPAPIPAELHVGEAPGSAFRPGWFLVHFANGVRPADRDVLDALTGPVRRADGTTLHRWYLPESTYAAWVADAGVLEALRGASRVEWVGRYQPAYKLDASIGRVAVSSVERRDRPFWRLHVDLIPGHSAAVVAQQLRALGAFVIDEVHVRGERGYDVHFLAVDALASDLVDIAQVEGVRTIQEAPDGRVTWDLSAGGKLQAKTLTSDNGGASIVNAANFPLWVLHDLQGQRQLIGVVDTALDFGNTGTAGCATGFPNANISNWGFADPDLGTLLLDNVVGGGVSLKVPRADLLGGATLQAGLDTSPGADPEEEHGCAVAGAALADYFGNDDTTWWEHDVDAWEVWAPTNFSGLIGPSIAHEAQLYFTPVDDDGAFAWEFVGEFETNMATTLANMAAAGACASVHSTGIVEAFNVYTELSAVHDLAAFDHPDLLQVVAAGNCGEPALNPFCTDPGGEQLTSQAVTKNVLTVGASDDVLRPEARAVFSSAGPRFDGSRKPDLLAPGTDSAPRPGGGPSLLMLPNNDGAGDGSCLYQFTQGTSFAAPIAAGAAALVHQYFEEGRYPGTESISDPSAALMKAMLVAAGDRLTGANLEGTDFPSFTQGWGEPVLFDVLDLPGSPNRLVVTDVSSADGLADKDEVPGQIDVRVFSSAEPLRITLVYTDEPSPAGTGKAQVNNLNLRVNRPDGLSYLGNYFDGVAGESIYGGFFDGKNNVECVYDENPQPGIWRIRVDPSNGPYSEGQGYALVVSGDVAEAQNPEQWYISLAQSAWVPGLGTVKDEDVFVYSPADDSRAMYFDGSDVGIGIADVDALSVRADGNILMSFRHGRNIPGLTGGPDGELVDDSDLVLFTFTQSGEDTQGSFSFFFDGSDVGLSSPSEDVVAVHEAGNGDITVSTLGPGSVPGVFLFRDEDAITFTPTSTGADTAGTWVPLFDGGDVAMKSNDEDIDAITGDGAEIVFSTTGDLAAKGTNGANEDLFWFHGTFGPQTSGRISRVLDLSELGINPNKDVDGVSLRF